MKKISKLLLLPILLMSCGVILVACGKTTQYTITPPAEVGFTFVRVDENGTGDKINKGKDYKFTITVNTTTHDGTLVVKASGDTLATTNDVYIIANVQSNKTITVEGLTAKDDGGETGHTGTAGLAFRPIYSDGTTGASTVSLSANSASSSEPTIVAYSVSRGTAQTIGETINIPATYNGKPVSVVEENAFKNRKGMQGVNIPNSIIKVGANAFENTDINLSFPESVTEIGQNAVDFSKTSFRTTDFIFEPYYVNDETGMHVAELTEGASFVGYQVGSNGTFDTTIEWLRTTPETLTVPATIHGQPVVAVRGRGFQYCRNLKTLNLPDSIVAIGDEAFNATAIMEAAANNSVVYVGKFAIGYKGTIPAKLEFKNDTVGVYMRAFGGGTNGEGTNGNTQITEVVFPATIRYIGYAAFFRCPNLEKVTFLGDSIDWIGSSAFSSCTKLAEINLPSDLKMIPTFMLASCYALTEIVIPDTVVSIGWGAFENNVSLTSLNLPSALKDISMNAFKSCTNLETISMPSTVENIFSDAFAGTKFWNNASDGIVYLSNWVIGTKGAISGHITVIDGTVGIGGQAFSGVNGLTGITLPDSLKRIGAHAFDNAIGLIDITLPDSLTHIGQFAFYGCTSLVEITIPSKVNTIMSSAFADCTNLETVTIADGVERIYGSAFENCTSLINVTLTNTLIELGMFAFANCTSLETIVIPASITDWGTRSGSGGVAFGGCTSLINVTLLDGLTSIGTGMFRGCTSLTNIIIPVSVTDIGGGAFTNTGMWNSAANGIVYADKWAIGVKGEMPSAVTLANDTVGIADDIFRSTPPGYPFPQNSLSSIIIPDSVKYIGSRVFIYNANMMTITIPNSVEIMGTNVFDFCLQLTINIVGNEQKPSGWHEHWNYHDLPVNWNYQG